jgi:hypothetical protein
VVPRQLPAAVPHFTGRAGELAALSRLLEPPAGASEASGGAVVISAIGGTAGIGKTALAVHWAHRVARRFPDGQLHVNLRGFDPSGSPVEPGEAVRGFLDALGIAAERIPATPEAQAALLRSLLTDRQMLIVLDNARDAQQVRPLLPGSPGCLVLVTSRNQLTGLAVAEGARLLMLDVLPDTEARELLARRLGARRASAEPGAVAELAGLCARLPLALSVVAARAGARPGFSLAALAAELRDARGRLDVLDTGEAATSVRAVFSWSYASLSARAARMFRLLGLHPGPDLTVPAAASLAGVPVQQARDTLAELTGAHLLAEHLPGRLACHDLLRVYAAERAHADESEAERHSAVGRMLDHYLYTAYAASIALYPARDPIALCARQPAAEPEHIDGNDDALAWLVAEHRVLVMVIAQAARDGFDAYAQALPETLATFLDRHGHWHDCITSQRIALAAAERMGTSPGSPAPTAISAAPASGSAPIRTDMRT